jgi:two-component system, chemotaxis family, protein-glutamate methylesterase/glutaminase
MPSHYVVAIGGSAGAVETLSHIVAGLPDDFPAAVCVVVHHSRDTPSALPHLLRRIGPLPAFHAAGGERLAPARIYVAPPDHHLVLEDGLALVVRGPAENGHRPSIDVLFRSAAQTYGSKAIAVVLSGMLDDGTAGLAAVKRNGGATIAEDPGEAMYPDMPRNAIASGSIDSVLTSERIAARLVQIVWGRESSYFMRDRP